MAEATLTSKGQITIPKAVREHLGLNTGARVDFVIDADGTVVLKPITRQVHELAGLLHRPGRRAVSIEAMDAAVRVRAVRRGARR